MTGPSLISIVITPLTPADRRSLDLGLRTLTLEDPAITVTANSASGGVVVAAVSELHLEIIIDRLKREFGVEASVGRPQIAYKETITRPASGAAKYLEQTDAGPRYAHVELSVYPSTGCTFENAILGGAIPQRFIGAIEQGIGEALGHGALTRYPVDDIRIVLDDGSYHEHDSSEAAFRICGVMAVRNAVTQARPRILQPIMRVQILVPPEDVDIVLRDLANRRAEVESDHTGEARRIITARVPLAGMFGYATELRSRTCGRGTFEMVFDRYDFVDMPENDAGTADSGVRAPRAPVPTPRLTSLAIPEPPGNDLDH
jgi:elongation factor G